MQRILARPGHGLPAADADLLRRMADWLDRNNLKIVTDNGAAGDGLEIVASDDVERFAFTVAELRALWTGMKAGRRVDWSALRRVPR